MMTGSSYPLIRATGRCAATGTPIEVGQGYVAALVERDPPEGSGGFERLDFSLNAWQNGSRPESPFVLFASWRSTMGTSEEKKRPLLGDADLLDLFEELARDTTVEGDARRNGFRYLLTLLLVRRRVLRVVSQREGELSVQRKVSVKDPTPQETFLIPDPGLSESAIQEALDQVGQIMDTGGEGTSGTTPGAGD